MKKKGTQEQKNVKRWTDVTGEMRVFAKDIGTNKRPKYVYSTSAYSKNEDGTFNNVYFDVRFKKDENPIGEEGMFAIIIKNGFITVNVRNNGALVPCVVVLDYDFTDEGLPG